jgi:putative ABC transport system permease protein
MDYFFLDQFFNRQYSQDRQFGRTFLIFSSLAICIACLGLLGLTFYTTARRTKEICIRKVVGATVTGIVSMLAWDTLKLVLLGGMVAVPVSWYVMSKWLEGYAFRIPLQAVHWLLPLGIIVLIACATIGYLTIRAAFTNPATTLRSE